MLAFDRTLLIGFEDSDLQLFNLTLESELMHLKTSDCDEHELGINGMDCLPSKNLMITCG
jgi:hypothetical protein